MTTGPHKPAPDPVAELERAIAEGRVPARPDLARALGDRLAMDALAYLHPTPTPKGEAE